jgi:vacuolar-type H+-ATPase subunit H
MSKFEQVISEIEEYIDNCNYFPLSNTKIVVVKEELEEMLHELRLKTPEEVKNYQRLLKNKDRIISEANEQARRIIDTAQIQTNELVNEHQIMQKAYEEGQKYIDSAKEEAQRLLDNAMEEANLCRQSAMEYTDQLLQAVQGILEVTVNDAGAQYERLISSCNETLNVVINNRSALQPTEDEEPVSESYEEQEYTDQQ